MTYAWRHLTERGSFAPEQGMDAKQTVFTPTSLTWTASWRVWSRPQTIRSYITYRGRTKYMDVEVHMARPIIAFDPASFPIYPSREPVTP